MESTEDRDHQPPSKRSKVSSGAHLEVSPKTSILLEETIGFDADSQIVKDTDLTLGMGTYSEATSGHPPQHPIFIPDVVFGNPTQPRGPGSLVSEPTLARGSGGPPERPALFPGLFPSSDQDLTLGVGTPNEPTPGRPPQPPIFVPDVVPKSLELTLGLGTSTEPTSPGPRLRPLSSVPPHGSRSLASKPNLARGLDGPPERPALGQGPVPSGDQHNPFRPGFGVPVVVPNQPQMFPGPSSMSGSDYPLPSGFGMPVFVPNQPQMFPGPFSMSGSHNPFPPGFGMPVVIPNQPQRFPGPSSMSRSHNPLPPGFGVPVVVPNQPQRFPGPSSMSGSHNPFPPGFVMPVVVPNQPQRFPGPSSMSGSHYPFPPGFGMPVVIPNQPQRFPGHHDHALDIGRGSTRPIRSGLQTQPSQLSYRGRGGPNRGRLHGASSSVARPPSPQAEIRPSQLSYPGRGGPSRAGLHEASSSSAARSSRLIPPLPFNAPDPERPEIPLFSKKITLHDLVGRRVKIEPPAFEKLVERNILDRDELQTLEKVMLPVWLGPEDDRVIGLTIRYTDKYRGAYYIEGQEWVAYVSVYDLDVNDRISLKWERHKSCWVIAMTVQKKN